MLKKLVLIFFVAPIFLKGLAQTDNYWQQQVTYTVNVSLNDVDNTLQGFEQIEYINNSPDTLHFIWFHLWPNAYKNDRTAFSEQLLKNNSTDFYFSNEEDKGYINQLNFEVNGVSATLQIDSVNIDVAQLILPEPLAPHQHIIIRTPFHEKLPYNFSRGGHVGQTYQIVQWLPKPAVFDRKGWHPMPYLDQGEFYSEFGNWTVNITLPENYIVAASGQLQNENELNHLKDLSKQKASSQKNYKLFQQLSGDEIKGKTVQPETLMPPSSKKTKTLIYTLNNAHDFAWFASKLFLVQHDTLQLNDYNIDVFAYYNPWQADEWKSSIKYMKDAVHFYSKNIGAYPYNIVSAVAGNDEVNSGGMEYPTITLITTSGSQQNLDATLAHEIGHNWFYGILATNERDHAWMDEGINEYYQQQYEKEKYGSTTDDYHFSNKFMQQRIPVNFNELQIASLEKIKKDQLIDAGSITYTETNYDLMVYEKTPLWLQQLKLYIGETAFDNCIKNYYQQWKFKHPYPENFKNSVEQSSNQNIDSLYKRLFKTGPIINHNQPKAIRFTTFFNLKETNKYNYVSVLPAVGYNYYDKVMVGAIIHNYQLPLNRFNFIAAPMYATGSNQFNGFGRVSFNTFKKRYWLETSVSGSIFSFDDFTDENNKTFYQRVVKIVPSVKLVLYNKDLRSTKRVIIQARSFLLREDALRFNTIQTPTDTFDIITKQPVNRYVNQINLTLLDNRILYPYSANITIDQGKEFVRAGFTGKYFFNYGKDKNGLNVRLFAGKFFYLNSKTIFTQFETDRYHLTLTGPKGYEDYTYSNCFIGRNEFSGLESQQIMERDGFFKVRTDLLSNKTGKTDDWLLSLNLTADLPEKINSLDILPFKFPIKFFVDVGTYSEAWKNNTSERFLYDAGLQLSVLHSLINVYVPLLYSKVYNNYFKSTLGEKRFLKTISFNIDLNVFKLNNISNKIPL